MRWLTPLIGILLVSPSGGSADELPRKIKPVMVWTGTDSKQTKQSFARCGSQKEWEAIWQKHRSSNKKTPRDPCPDVDFASYMVVVVFYGKSDSNTGISVKEVGEEKECIRLRYKPRWYQTAFLADATGSEEGWRKTFAFVVLPRSAKTIILEEDVQNIINAPAVWKEQAKLVAPGKK